jgi:DNA polymerase-3 subunit gamma/tau
MSNYIVSARKYRPDHFDAVIGQPSVTNTLKNAISSGQVAHAYLFCGPRGVGKTTCARIFAKTLNCLNRTAETEACNQCESCQAMKESRSFNIHELDAASNNSIEDIRSLIDKVRILPQLGKYSVYIIDEVHMLSASAFNAFLKTLEEPPPHAIFILATTEKHKIIPTILSRCQVFDFHRIRLEDIATYLSKVARLDGILYEEEALSVIAMKADGAMRDALSIFDQVASFSNRNITYREVLDNLNVLDYEYYFKITECFLEASADKALLLFNEILQKGFDGQNFIGGLSSHLRDLLVSKDEATLPLLEVSDVLKSRYKEQARVCTSNFLFNALEVCSQCELNYRASRNQRLHVEISLIRLSNLLAEKKNLIKEIESISVPPLSQPEANSKKNDQVIEVIARQTEFANPELSSAKGNAALQYASTNQSHAAPVSTSVTSSFNISIKDALGKAVSKNLGSEADEDVTQEIEDITEVDISTIQPVTPALLSLAWNSFSDQIREKRPRMAVTLKAVQPVILEKNLIAVELNNRTQLDDFNSSTRMELEKFLRSELQNPGISIQANLVEQDENQQVKLYTSEEKFRYLSKKNPGLENFRQKLNLELE